MTQQYIYSLEQAYETFGEDLVNQQVALELESATYGRERFLKDYERAKEMGGSDFVSNKVVKPLVDTLVHRLSKGITEFCEKDWGRNKPKALNILSRMKADVCAYITVSTVLGTIVGHKEDSISFMQVVGRLNKYIFEELKYSSIREEEMEMFRAFLDEGVKKRVGHSYKELYLRRREIIYKF